MILVACVGAGLALYRPLWPAIQSQYHGPVRIGPILRFYYFSATVFPILATLTLAVPILRLRSPRPRLRCLFRQAGMAACVVASLAMSPLATSVYLTTISPYYRSINSPRL